jgi:hypothetical protein
MNHVRRARWRMRLFDQLPKELRERIAEHNASDAQLVKFVGDLPRNGGELVNVPLGLVRKNRRGGRPPERDGAVEHF